MAPLAAAETAEVRTGKYKDRHARMTVATPPLLAFHVDLLQDVGVLRPLVRLAAEALPRRDRLLLVSSHFAGRDKDGTWAGELATLSAETGTPIATYGSELEACRLLAGRHGMVIAGSESSLPNHAVTHALFRALPPEFRTVALQHGFECIGFMHNSAHEAVAGSGVRFAADVIAGWFNPARLTDIPPADRGKLIVTGPPMLIEHRPAEANREAAAERVGIICENLHSVRFDANSRESFSEVLEQFAQRARQVNERFHLRPHPAGRFTTKSKASSPGDHVLATQPLHRSEIHRAAYGISGPSTVLFDFVLADVPVGLWADAGVDSRNFKGLNELRTADDWWRFAQRSRLDREALLMPQRRFVERLDMPGDVAARYCRLMASI